MANAEENFRVYDDKTSVFTTSEALNLQRKSSQFCDVILKVFDAMYPVHSNVLAATSPYLSVFLNRAVPRHYSQSVPQLIELQIDDSASNEQYKLAVSCIIDFMYSGKLKISYNHMSKISHIAKILQISKIVDYCTHFNNEINQQQEILIQHAPVQENAILNQQTVFHSAENVISNFKTTCISNEVGSGLESDVLSSGDEEKDRSDVEDELLGSNKSLNKTLSCSSCTYTTLSNYHLKRHMATHNGGRYYCDMDQCGFSTFKLKNLTKHQREHTHKMNICSYCSFQAETQEKLESHLKIHNMDVEKPFFCSECDKRFKNKTQLNLHAPTHSTFKPYVCEVCGTGFKWKHSLSTHKVVHTNEKNHLCDICGYATAHKSQLKAHKLIHTGDTFKCPYSGCSFQAIKRNNLKYHMLTHTRERPHQCETCGQSFSLIKNLRRHRLLHSTDKPHQCDHCSFSTTRFDKLRDHLRRHHSIGLPPQRRVGPNHPPPVQNQILTNVSTVISSANSNTPIQTQLLAVNSCGQQQSSSVQNVIIESVELSNVTNQATQKTLTIHDLARVARPQNLTDINPQVSNMPNVMQSVELSSSELLNLRPGVQYFEVDYNTSQQNITSQFDINKQSIDQL